MQNETQNSEIIHNVSFICYEANDVEFLLNFYIESTQYIMQNDTFTVEGFNITKYLEAQNKSLNINNTNSNNNNKNFSSFD